MREHPTHGRSGSESANAPGVPARAPGGGGGTGAAHEGGSQNGRGATPHAEVYPLRDFGGVRCAEEIELVIFRFASFGRLAHFRRSLLALPQVQGARISSYGDQTAFFALNVSPGTDSAVLELPGTKLIGSDGRRVELTVQG